MDFKKAVRVLFFIINGPSFEPLCNETKDGPWRGSRFWRIAGVDYEMSLPSFTYRSLPFKASVRSDRRKVKFILKSTRWKSSFLALDLPLFSIELFYLNKSSLLIAYLLTSPVLIYGGIILVISWLLNDAFFFYIKNIPAVAECIAFLNELLFSFKKSGCFFNCTAFIGKNDIGFGIESIGTGVGWGVRNIKICVVEKLKTTLRPVLFGNALPASGLFIIKKGRMVNIFIFFLFYFKG